MQAKDEKTYLRLVEKKENDFGKMNARKFYMNWATKLDLVSLYSI